MTDEKKDSTDKQELQSYRAIGMVFLITGLGLIIPESTRATGVPFLILGATFTALGQQKSATNRKK